MLARNSGGPAHRVGDGEARKFVGTGKRDGRTSKLAKSNTQDAITALLIGDDVCTAEGYTVRASAPALTMCRRLIKTGIDSDRPLHCYRANGTLCLTIRSIGEGAALTVAEGSRGAPRFRRWRAMPSREGSPPMRPNGREAP
jgi:hypothetical protein